MGGVIVVGVDQSAGAKQALRFALEEARLRQAKLRAVRSWQTGYIGVPGIEDSLPAIGPELEESRRAAEIILDATLHEVAAEASDVEIERRVDQGAPAPFLSQNLAALTCLSWAHADTAASRSCCWARSVSSALTTLSARL